jgi:cytochrome c-type biogenesis protein CcmE
MSGIVLKREQAISVLKELLDNSVSLDGHGLELAAPNGSTSGYQIVIRGKLDEQTKQHIQETLTKHQLAYQAGNIWRTKHSPNKIVPDTFIIYKSK